MALFRCSSGGGGTNITLDKLLYSSSKTLLGSITTYNGSWTATEDCVMYGYGKASGSSTTSPMVYLNGSNCYFSNGSGSQFYVGYTSSALSTPDTYGIFIPKGTVITTRNQSGQTYKLQFYTL